MDTQSNSSLDIEKYHQDIQIKDLTYKVFGSIPVDEKYLPIMNAWLNVFKAEYAEKILMGLIGPISSGDTSALIEQINKNRDDLSKALNEYIKLTNEGRM